MYVPNTVSAQLGNRVAACVARVHPAGAEGGEGSGDDVPQKSRSRHRKVIMELKVGEALVSMLENKGEPSMVQRTFISSARGPLEVR